LLLIDAETGKSEEFPVPFPPGGDCPYASILCSGAEPDPAWRSYLLRRKQDLYILNSVVAVCMMRSVA